MHDPRGKYSVGLAYALSEKGAESYGCRPRYNDSFKDQFSFKEIMPLGILEPEKPTKFSP